MTGLDSLPNSTITYVAYASGLLFVVGVGLLSFVTFRVGNWMTEAEYDQSIEDDIAKKDVTQTKDRKKFEETFTAIEKLKKDIKEEEEEQGIVTKTQSKDKKEKDKTKVDNDEDKDSMTAEEKHKADINAILNLPTY